MSERLDFVYQMGRSYFLGKEVQAFLREEMVLFSSIICAWK